MSLEIKEGNLVTPPKIKDENPLSGYDPRVLNVKNWLAKQPKNDPSKIKSSLKSEDSRTVSWTEEDKQRFNETVLLYGVDYEKIMKAIGTKVVVEIENYIHFLRSNY